MTILRPEQVMGDLVQLRRLHPLHLGNDGRTGPLAAPATNSFSGYLMQAMNGVNDLQNQASDISVRAVTDPDSVDPQDVTIALAEATLALSITRTVFERAIRAYNDVIAMR